MRFSFQSDLSHQLDDNLGEVENFQAWKYRISLVIEGNELDTYISREVPVPEGDEAKALLKANNIITDSIEYHLIPQVSSLKTPKEMFDSLTKLFEWKNINWNMTLRKQLKNVKIQNAEQLEVVEEVENAEVVITTLNGLLGSWDSFVRGMCAKRK